MDKFLSEFEVTMAHFDQPDFFDISPEYSAVYHRFLALDLAHRPAIRGQLEGPISFGMNVLDENKLRTVSKRKHGQPAGQVNESVAATQPERNRYGFSAVQKPAIPGNLLPGQPGYGKDGG